jgi:hypothetical protein
MNNSSPEIIGPAVMMYFRYAEPLRNGEDLLAERNIIICREMVRFRRDRFGLASIVDSKWRLSCRRGCSECQWHLDVTFVKINGETHCPWRVVDHESESHEGVVAKRPDRQAASHCVLPSYGAAMNALGKRTSSCSAFVAWRCRRNLAVHGVGHSQLSPQPRLSSPHFCKRNCSFAISEWRAVTAL